MKSGKLVLFAVVALLFVGCSSVPKKEKDGACLVIGQASVNAKGYDDFYGLKLKGFYEKGIKLFFQNEITGNKVSVTTDSDGFFCIKGLNADEGYKLVRVELKVESDGVTRTLWCDFDNPRRIVPVKNAVLNIGYTGFNFDGEAHMVRWLTDDYADVQKLFFEQNADSEWYKKRIVEQ